MANDQTHICPVCHHVSMQTFIDIKECPVFCNILCESRQQALEATKGDIQLSYCSDCGMIYNTAFNPELMNYTGEYENSLHFSSHFQEFANKLANRLVEKYKLNNKDIIEIGCGQGDFLSLLQEKGNNRCFGFDPSYRGDADQVVLDNKAIQIIPEAYNENYTRQAADFIYSRHVLEHIDTPAAFLSSIRKTIDDRLNIAVYFEVPNALYTLKDLGIWDIIYEHCSYFTPTSISNLFKLNQFDVNCVTQEYGGQFLSIECMPSKERKSQIDYSEDKTLSKLVTEFSLAYASKVSEWQHRIKEYKSNNKKVVLWGAGSKGVTFLNIMNIPEDVCSCIVDLNPRKHGKYVVGTGQKIISPEELPEISPDVVVIMNPLYNEEISKSIEALGLSVDIVNA